MCGIVGCWDGEGGSPQPDLMTRMSRPLAHRGPDDSGVWSDLGAGIHFGHRRLAILDLTSAGHQPMSSRCGRFTIVYNGEIYNHLEIRARLDREGAGFEWRGHSDTETLLYALKAWGIDQTLPLLNGMFAFALWNRLLRRLYLARDRMGKKPLYYGRCGSAFVFSSELKGLTAHPDWNGDIDRDSLALYLRMKSVPSPWSIYRGISKLRAAHYVVVRGQGAEISEQQRYWDLARVSKATQDTALGNSGHLTDRLEALLGDAVSRRMVADVPVGAFLSGGIDSSTVVALMQSRSLRPVQTFTIGFCEQEFDEAVRARAVACHLGTEHHELYVSSADALAVIPQLPNIWDEPFADSSQIPAYLISRLARGRVTVALSGDGGDELFMGYEHHLLTLKFQTLLERTPASLRRIGAAVLKGLPFGAFASVPESFPRLRRLRRVPDRRQKLAAMLDAKDAEQFYERLVTHWQWPDGLVLGTGPKRTPAYVRTEGIDGLIRRMTYSDMMIQLPDQFLVKVDRASMAVGLEARAPLLDNAVVEFALGLPANVKFRSGKSKWLLRQVLYRHVPQRLVDGPKRGFSLPVEHWIRGPMREWAESLLSVNVMEAQGYLDPKPIRKMWEEHLKGAHRWHTYLWGVLMFQAWLRGIGERERAECAQVGSGVGGELQL
jgi:asparagine synthase (glutamine-hydrolysing)